MNDMSATIIAKSDQWNASDLVGGPITVTVREVRIKASDDQPVSLLLEGQDKVFRPCKGVRRLLVNAWGPDANNYIGGSLTLFRDPSVTWAGKEEGGIRVSHMSGIDKEFVEWMRTSRAATKPYKIKPLVVEQAVEKPDPATKWANGYIAKVNAATTIDELDAFANSKASKLAELEAARADLHQSCVKARDASWVRKHKDEIDAALSDDELVGVEVSAAVRLGSLPADLHAEVLHAYQTRRSALSFEGRPDDAFGEQHVDGEEG